MTSITIPDSVTSIGAFAFGLCNRLTEITIPKNVATIDQGAFAWCYHLQTVHWNAKNCTIEGYTTQSIFYNVDYNPLTTVTIGNEVEQLPDYFLADCYKVSSITIPNSVTSIGKNAFDYCNKLTAINIPDSVTEIGECAFRRCEGLKEITIPRSVTLIGDSAFDDCSGLQSVIWNAENCTVAGSFQDYIFNYCKNLTKVTFGANVKTIPEYAFYDCEGLKEITIPRSVTLIGENAFSGCSNLKNAYFLDPNGWKRYAYNSTSYDLSASDLSNSVTAASCLTDKYDSYEWRKG